MTENFIIKHREQFPTLSRYSGDAPIVYFDNAASTLKPQSVIDAVHNYYSTNGANIHRGRHLLSEEASEIYESCRQRVARFLNASAAEIVFVQGTTQAINLVANGLGLSSGDNVVGTILDHHSNILPWSHLCEFRTAPLGPNGLPDIEAAQKLIDKNTKLITVPHLSNVTGAIVPVEQWAKLAHDHGVHLMVDAAQAASHIPIDTRALDCDFLALSGHKMFAPSGCGVLFGKESALRKLTPPWLGGGAVSRVYADGTYDLRDIPWRFESGTPPIASIIGFNEALRYIESIGISNIKARNDVLSTYLQDKFASIRGLSAITVGRDVERAPIISFTNIRSDVASRVLSDSYGIMTRGGHHCAHPLHASMGVDGSLRLSLHFYNTTEEIDKVADVLESVLEMIRFL
jgi:cysteine desulfurase/selenocysteine lyase